MSTYKNGTWWPTPVTIVEYEDSKALNAGLAKAVLEEERKIRGMAGATAIAGVESGMTSYWLKYNVLNWNYPECAQFREMVLDGARAFIAAVADPADPDYEIVAISCWANVIRRGEGLTMHHHDPGFVSAHYTVQSGQSPGDQATGGHTVYYRPGFVDRSHGDSFGGPWDADWRLSVPPTEGRLTLFPSYVRHEVQTHMGEKERISIAMDIYIRKQRGLPFHFSPPRWFLPGMKTKR